MQFGVASGTLGAGASTLIAFQMARNLPEPEAYSEGIPKEEQQRYTVTFEPERVAIKGRERYFDTPDGLPPFKDPDSKIKVRRGTGYHTIDWKEEEAFGGVDTVFWGMVNQINYRILSNVQHCYRSDKCNAIIRGRAAAPGWIRGRYSGINFKDSPLRMPGYPAHDAHDDYCLYGNIRCPKQNLDRRAVEFNNNYQVLLREILLPFRAGGVQIFAPELIEGFIVVGRLKFLAQSEFAQNPNAMCVAVRQEGGNLPVIGHWNPVVQDDTGNRWRVFFYYDQPSWSSVHRLARVAAHLIQFDGRDQPAYMPVPSAFRAEMTTLYGNPDAVPWLVELYDDYRDPAGNLLYPTNSKPFAGGRNPEYRDHSKRGRQIVCKFGGIYGLSGSEGATWSNQFGGPPTNTVSIKSQSRMGYWTDKYGEFIIGSTPIPSPPADPPPAMYVPVSARIRNKPSWYNGAVPIDGAPSMEIQDPEEPSNNRQSDYAAVGHTYSTDTKALIDWFHQRAPGDDYNNWQNLLPKDPDTDEPIPCAAPSPDTAYLPLERAWFQCSVCGIDFSQEEINFFADHRELVPLPQNPPTGATMGCPRHCGGVLFKRARYDHFLETRARGEVDFWAPPGTTVRTDGFFWKEPTLVSRAHLDQIFHKLGGYHPTGGGYSFDRLDAKVEFMGRMPPAQGMDYNPGLAHQIVAPWAADGDTVAAVRQRIGDYYGLLDTDYAKLVRFSATAPVVLTFQQEAGTTLAHGDMVMFFRKNLADEEVPVGIPVFAAMGPPGAILAEQVVRNDPPRPQRSSFPQDDTGERMYQDAIRQWLIGVVQGSLYNWATMANIGAYPNPLAESLRRGGNDPAYGNSINPTDGSLIPIDERIIGPYGATEEGGLKMITLPALKRLRNRILPMLAYDLSDPTAGTTAAGDYTAKAQASNDDRFTTARKGLPFRSMGVIPPQVLAATETGLDYYVEWEQDDMVGTKCRAYYPVGTTWWRLNQKVGQIKRSGGTNALHLDDAGRRFYWWDEKERIPIDCYYTGDTITSTCTFFLHGRIPMDKEVVRAFVVYQTEPGPYAAPLGCQGGYTGYVAPIGVNGEPNWEDKKYKGNTQCFWQHYHPWRMEADHEADKGGGPVYRSYWGPGAKAHCEKFSTWQMQYEIGQAQTQSQMPSNPPIVPQSGLESDIEGSYRPWMGEKEDVNYLDQVNILSMSFVEQTHGFGFDQPFLMPWRFGEDLQQTRTEHAMWKDISFAKYDELRERYHTIGQAALDGNEVVTTFDYWASEFRQQVYSHEQQGISGWIDFTSYDNCGRFPSSISIAEKLTDADWANGPQVIVQAADPTGGNGPQMAGDKPRVIECTDLIRRLYNDRVTRFYRCKLGWSFAQLASAIPALTDTNINNHVARFHSGYQEPRYFWNYRYVEPGVGMWLNDPWHHTPLINDQPVAPGSDGDPMIQTSADKQARASYVTEWDTQGASEGSPDYKKFHPWQLCNATADLVQNGPIVSPAPDTSMSGYWRAVSNRMQEQFFEMDLRQTPLENTHRAWRYQQPKVDATNAICPNVANCSVAQNGYTMGQLYEQSTASWGLDIYPSMSSEYCPVCGTKLVGVVYFDGDGIETVAYDPAWVSDALLTAVDIALDDAQKHGFAVEYFNSVTQVWRVLFSVQWDGDRQKWRYPRWDGAAWVVREADALPARFVGAEGVGTTPKAACHFVAVGAAKVRFKVLRPAEVPRSDPGSGWGTGTVESGKLRVAALADPREKYIHRTIAVKDNVLGTTRTLTIVECEGSNGSYLLGLSGSLRSDETGYRIDWTDYVSTCKRFQVYGWPYREGDVTATPPPYTQMVYFSEGNNVFRLNAWATKVLRVECSSGTRLGIALNKVDAPDSTFLWTVEKVTTGGVAHLEITGGKFYYDHKRNSIILPSLYMDPDSGLPTSIWAMNAALYNDPNSTFDLATLPRQLVIEYITGLGVPVEVSVEAHAKGPSYQVEAESVCLIAGHGQGTAALPAGATSNANAVLPDMGDSEKMASNDNQPVKLYWQVYNHEPIIWDYRMTWLSGDELGPGASDKSSVMNVFSGGKGADLSDLGPNSALSGLAAGTVTLYGMPNTILAGDLLVYAKDYAERTYHLPGNQTVDMAERTGGFRSGAVVFTLSIGQSVTAGRKGIMCSVPRLLVYVRERDLDLSREAAPLR